MKRPLAIIRLHPDKEHRVRVFIWATDADMYAALEGQRFSGSQLADSENNYGGYFGSPPIRIDAESGKVVSKLVGDIHIPIDNMGAGVLAGLEKEHIETRTCDHCGGGGAGGATAHDQYIVLGQRSGSRPGGSSPVHTAMPREDNAARSSAARSCCQASFRVIA